MKIQKKDKGTKIKPVPNVKTDNKLAFKPISNKIFIWLSIITISIFFSYSSSLKNKITNWDDDQYVEKNPWFKELSTENVKSIFSSYYMGNYHPMAILSLVIDYHIAKKDKKGNYEPLAFHLTNLILHIINSLLVFWLIFLLLSNFEIAVISSLLFGLCTLHVESVAWISERKDVLYALFYIASLISYVLYIKKGSLKNYLLAILFFIISLFSKGQAVSLAITLFAIDYLLDRKILEKKAIFDKIPFLILALIFGFVAIKAQKAGNALSDVDSYEFYKRIGFAGYGFTQYLIKLVIPTNLSAIYPYPDIVNKTIPAYYWLFMIPALIVVFLFFKFFKRSKFIAFCIAFFIINIALLLQFIPVGSATWADRYSYIPSISFHALTAWLIVKWVKQYENKRNFIYGILGLYIVTLGILSFMRCKVWENSLSLWDDTIEKSPKAVVAWNNRGSLKDRANQYEEAIKDFTKAVEIKPDYTHAFYNRGTAKKNLAEKTKDSMLIKSAIEDFNYALKLNHAFIEALHSRSITKELLSEYSKTTSQRTAILHEALEDLNKALNLDPKFVNGYLSRGVIKGKLNQLDEAIIDFNKVIEISPDSASAYGNRGYAKNLKGDIKGAITDYDEAIKLNPNFDNAYHNRGIAYRNLGKYIESIEDLTKAILLNPNQSESYYFRGLDFISINKKDDACKDLQKASNLGYPYAKQEFIKNCNKQEKQTFQLKPSN